MGATADEATEDPLMSAELARSFRTRIVGADAVVAQIDEMYGAGTSFTPGPRAQMTLAGVADERAKVTHTKIDARFAGVGGYAQPVILRPRSGRLEMRAPDDGRPSRAGQPILYPVDVDIPFALSDIDLDIVQLSRQILLEAAGEASPDAEPLRLDRAAGLRRPYAAAWWAALEQVRRVYANDDLYANELIRESALRHLGAVTVAGFALSEAPLERVTRAGRLVRAAERYIDENIGSPLTGAQIASACGVSVRALQLAFRDERETTPSAYIRERRLERVRNALLAADPAVHTVSRIALTWGFGNAGRFAGSYYAAFGEYPRDTLLR